MSPKSFEYQVRDRSGKVVKGKIEAESSSEVATKLKGMGMAPMSINAVGGGGLRTEIKIPGFGGRIKLKELAVMARQLAVMIDAGLPLLRALTILESQTTNKTLAGVLSKVRTDVQTGNSLSQALARHPTVFPPLMIYMVRAGEVGGFLDDALLEIAQNVEADVKLHGKIKSAMTYPIVVGVIAILAMIIMLVFIVPVFAEMFKQLGGELPLPTQILVVLSNALRVGSPFLVILLIALLITWKQIKHKPRVRNIVDPMKLKMPVFGALFQKVALARFSRNLGTMVHAGVPILQALDIVADTSGNVVVVRAMKDVQNSVRNGETLAKPLAKHPVFPSMMVQMMSVGEDTGALDTMLSKIAEFYDAEVEATTDALTSLIEPLMIAFVGALVGAMVIALYLPIFKVFDLIK